MNLYIWKTYLQRTVDQDKYVHDIGRVAIEVCPKTLQLFGKFGKRLKRMVYRSCCRRNISMWFSGIFVSIWKIQKMVGKVSVNFRGSFEVSKTNLRMLFSTKIFVVAENSLGNVC